MENRILTHLRNIMTSFGLSIEMMDVTSEQHPYPAIEQFMWNAYISKSDEEIFSDIVAMKKAMCRQLYEIDFCPFEKLTTVSWEAMLAAFIARKEKPEHGRWRMPLPWMHLVVSSAHYPSPPLTRELVRYPLYAKLDHVGQEYVEINDVQYAYGESKIIVERIRSKEARLASPNLMMTHPTFVLDERLIPLLTAQQEWPQVLEILFAINHLVSHDGLIHAVFLEGDKKIRDAVLKDDMMKKLLEVHYFCYDMYEINYTRMMRAIVDVVCESNPAFRTDVRALVSELETLTAQWPSTIQQYVRFIAAERVSRIIGDTTLFPTLQRYLGGTTDGDVDQPITAIGDGEYVHIMTHHKPTQGALVHNSRENFSDLWEIPWEAMTTFMFNCYLTV